MQHLCQGICVSRVPVADVLAGGTAHVNQQDAQIEIKY